MTCPPIPCLDIPTPAAPASAGTALPWPPSGRQSAWKPTGGFFLCPIPYLTLPWALYEHGALSFLSLRAWCGVLELPERRHDFVLDHEVHYSVDELRRLLQVPRLAPVQTALHALEEVGLLTWASDRIVCFPTPATFRDCDLAAYTDRAGAASRLAHLDARAPRRLLRWLARDGTPGLWATAAGVLLRCMWSKGRTCVSGGRIAARWIARGFGIAERTVHRAFDDLQACDWLARLPSTSPDDAAQERRYGARTVINLTWDPPVPDPVAIPANAAAATAPGRRRAGRSTGAPSGQTQVVTQGDVVEHVGILDHNMSPAPPTPVPLPPGTSRASTPAFGADLSPFQEEDTPDPVPARRAPHNHPPGAAHNTSEKDADMSALSPTPPCVSPPPSRRISQRTRGRPCMRTRWRKFPSTCPRRPLPTSLRPCPRLRRAPALLPRPPPSRPSACRRAAAPSARACPCAAARPAGRPCRRVCRPAWRCAGRPPARRQGAPAGPGHRCGVPHPPGTARRGLSPPGRVQLHTGCRPPGVRQRSGPDGAPGDSRGTRRGRGTLHYA